MDENGFIIEDGILKGYRGPDVETLVIPEGVTATARHAFSRDCNLNGCRKIVFPRSLKCVGEYALDIYRLKDLSLRELEFLGDVETIGKSAFRDVPLTGIVFHGTVGEIADGAFYGTGITELAVSAVKKIGDYAFSRCNDLRELRIAQVGAVGEGAFSGCERLVTADIPATLTNIGSGAFCDCPGLKKDGVVAVNGILYDSCGIKDIPEGIVKIEKNACPYSRKRVTLSAGVRVIEEQPGSVVFTAPHEMLQTTDKLSGRGLLNNLAWTKLEPRDWAAILLYQSGKTIDALCAGHMTGRPERYLDEMLSLLEEKGGKDKHYRRAAEFILAHIDRLDRADIRRFYEQADAKKMKGAKALVEGYISEPETDRNDPLLPFKKKYSEHLLDRTITENKGHPDRYGAVRLAGSGEFAPAFLVKCAVVPYLAQYTGRPKKIGEYETEVFPAEPAALADRAAAMLDRSDLQALIAQEYDRTVEIWLPKANTAWLFPLGRYGSGAQIAELVSDMTKWKDWNAYGAAGRGDIITARGALMLSDTREAMMALDRSGHLDEYAQRHGTQADVLRDTVMADFGLDVSGQKVYDLGTKKVTVTLSPELTFVLFDEAQQKIVKSVPKRGADPALYEAAAADLDQMKRNAKKIAAARNDMLFERFLSGERTAADTWLAAHTQNALLRRIAELIVWCQGNATFIMTEDGPANARGGAFTVDPKGTVRVAHPMEMRPQEREDWQKYFTSHGLKQPFLQIWEPVVDPKSVRPDRYEGCLIPYSRLRNRQRDGIHIVDEDFHNDVYAYFSDCSAEAEQTAPERHYIDNNSPFTVKNFTFRRYTRRTNHIVTYLDRVTVYDRVLNDDPSVTDILGEFTLAQLTEFIAAASEHGCTNCLAALLEYKNRHYAEYDPMDIFTL